MDVATRGTTLKIKNPSSYIEYLSIMTQIRGGILDRENTRFSIRTCRGSQDSGYELVNMKGEKKGQTVTPSRSRARARVSTQITC